MKEKILNLLGIAKRAGYIVSGTDSVIMEMRKNRAKIVFVASDSSEKTIDNFKRKCYFYNVECNFDFNSEELSHAIGQNRKIICLKDQGIYNAIQKYLRGDMNES